MPTRLRLVILLGLVVVAVTSFGLTAGAAPEDEPQGEVEAAQQRLAEMRMEAGSAYEAHDNAVLQLSELDKEIVVVSRELGEAEGELAEAQGRLEERAAQMYKSGNVGFVDVLVGAEDFSDFAERLDLWMRLLAQERAEFEEIREARDDIAERKASLEAKRDRRAAAVGEADDQIDRASQLEEESQAYLDSLNAELREAMEAEQAAAAERAKQRGRELRAKIAEVEPEVVIEEPAPEPAAEEVEAPPAEEPVDEAEAPAEPPAPVISNIAAKQAAADRAAEKAAAERYAEEKAAAAREARRQAEAAEAAEQERLRQEAIRAERRAQLAKERAAAQAAAEKEARRQARIQAEQQAAAEAAAQEQAAQQQQQPANPGGAGADQYAGPGAAGGQPANGGNNAGGGQPAGGGQNTGAGGGTASGSAVVAEAAKYMGTPYVLGGTADCIPYEAMDCTCLTATAYQPFGFSLPDTLVGQFGFGTPVSGAPMAGDLLFWNEDGSGLTHSGIATGNGTTIHASAFAGYVTETAIDDIPGYVGARRLL